MTTKTAAIVGSTALTGWAIIAAGVVVRLTHEANELLRTIHQEDDGIVVLCDRGWRHLPPSCPQTPKATR